MKTNTFFLIFFILSICAKSQMQFDSVCVDFESKDTIIFIQGQNSTWQIGDPVKTVFNGSYNSNNSIVTDTLNPYPINDTSYFYAIYKPAEFKKSENWYFPFKIEFYQRYDTDSLKDFGSVELSLDEGKTWLNCLSGDFNYIHSMHYYKGHYNQNDPNNNSMDSLLYSDRQDDGAFAANVYNTRYENIESGEVEKDASNITGQSNGWIHAVIIKDVDQWYTDSWENVKEIIVKFSFFSDDIQNNKDGWQIDNLCIGQMEIFGGN